MSHESREGLTAGAPHAVPPHTSDGAMTGDRVSFGTVAMKSLTITTDTSLQERAQKRANSQKPLIGGSSSSSEAKAIGNMRVTIQMQRMRRLQ